jgi:hypothetical protein
MVQRYRPTAMEISAAEEAELRDNNDNAPQYMRTTGRYQPYGVSHKNDRDRDGDDMYFQNVRRNQFDPVQRNYNHVPSNRPCRADEDRIHDQFCRKKCKTGWKRNSESLRCYKDDAVRRRRFDCRKGYERNATTGRCRKIRNQGGNGGNDGAAATVIIPEIEALINGAAGSFIPLNPAQVAAVFPEGNAGAAGSFLPLDDDVFADLFPEGHAGAAGSFIPLDDDQVAAVVAAGQPGNMSRQHSSSTGSNSAYGSPHGVQTLPDHVQRLEENDDNFRQHLNPMDGNDDTLIFPNWNDADVNDEDLYTYQL